MRIAIASSGLGHVTRGVEAWAADTAEALAGLNIDVTLFSAADKPAHNYETTLASRRRGDPGTQRLARRLPKALWRWALTTPYGIEQCSFALHLQKYLRRGNFDIVHVQDPAVADWCRRLRRFGRLRCREILSHGTEESPNYLARFPHVLHLGQWHYDTACQTLAKTDAERAETITRHWRVIPNFIDTQMFSPAAERVTTFREKLGIDGSARVYGCVATVKRHHKRIDYLIREFGALLAAKAEAGEELPWLLIAGAAHEDSPALQSLADELGRGHIQVFLNLPRSRMPVFCQSLDAFLLTSLFEMQPIAILEALATGVPVIAHQHPALKAQVGPGGTTLDLNHPGALAAFLRDGATREWVVSHGEAARQHAEQVYSREAVIDKYIGYYQHLVSAR